MRTSVTNAILGAAFASSRAVVAQGSGNVPQYVLDYAPLVWLDSTELYKPADIGSQLLNTYPALNYTPITNGPSPLTLDNLDQLNALGGSDVYLTSKDDFTQFPSWLGGILPNSDGKTEGAVSCAIILNEKPNDTVDAFYMYFYAYDQGNKVFNLGDWLESHVGDWEHNMIRFVNSTPTAIWYSEHANGEAFDFSAVQKRGQRPVGYSANGTHANWATSGTHDHTIPDFPSSWGPLEDVTDEGTLWDPLLNAYYYSVTFPSSNGANDSSNPTFSALTNPYGSPDSSSTGSGTPVNWLYYQGQWGDKQLNSSDSRQTLYFGEIPLYASGPNGPQYKNLNRENVCPNNGDLCIIRTSLSDGE